MLEKSFGKRMVLTLDSVVFVFPDANVKGNRALVASRQWLISMPVLLAWFMDRTPLSLADIDEFIEENGVFSVLIDALFYRNKDQK